MVWVYITIIILLLIIVLTLSISLFFFIKKSDYISDKDKEFIEFVIDMYIQYAEELEIHSKAQHKKIVEKLEEIKNKYFKINKNKIK